MVRELLGHNVICNYTHPQSCQLYGLLFPRGENVSEVTNSCMLRISYDLIYCNGRWRLVDGDMSVLLLISISVKSNIKYLSLYSNYLQH
jgi:hypothetical protein